MTERQNQFAALLYRCVASWRGRLDERLRPHGLSYSSWRILHSLTVADERLNQSSLARRIGIETPTLVRLLDRMEKLQWVRREPDAQDRRQKHVEITARGRALVGEVESDVLAVRESMLAGLSDKELQAGVALLEKLLGNA